jgi:hypothetical protein
MKEYRYGTFLKVFGYLFVTGTLVGAHFSIKAGFEASTARQAFLFFGLAALCIAVALFLIREIKISKFGIGIDRVYLVSMIYNRTLYFDQISGWRQVEQEFHILPSDKTLKKIRVTMYFKDSAEIRHFLIEHFPNLDDVEAETEHLEIVQNAEFGITEEARLRRLEQARKAARYTEWAGWALALWIFFAPRPYELSVTLGIVYPFLAVALCFLYRGLIRSDGGKKSPYPTVLTTIIVVPMMVAYRAIVDVHILSYGNGWILMIITTMILFVSYQVPTGGFSFRKKADILTFWLVLLLLMAYGYGTVTLTNAIADSSQPVVYPTVIKAKRISSGKSTTYYLELKKWGNLTEDEEVSVHRSQYDFFAVGDSIHVNLRPGVFSMPWIQLE